MYYLSQKRLYVPVKYSVWLSVIILRKAWPQSQSWVELEVGLKFNPFTPELKQYILPTFQKAIVWVM